MTTIVLVRSLADMNVAIDSINHFLAYRRLSQGMKGDDGILAIGVRPRLDAGLPQWLRVDPDSSDSNMVMLRSSEIGVVHSVSLSGIWAWCWLDGPGLQSARTPAKQREKILRYLMDPGETVGRASEHAAFFPVFDADASAGSVETEISALQDRHPGMIASRVFRYDKTLGLIGDRVLLEE